MVRLSKNFSSLEFYQLDKLLFLSEKYHTTLSPLAKLVYTFFYDRSRLSDIKGFHDENGDVFFFYKIETVMHMLNCSKPKALSVKKELLTIGLLEEVKTGRASKLYLHSLEQDGYTDEEIIRFNEPDEDETIWTESQKKQRSETHSQTLKEKNKDKEIIKKDTFDNSNQDQNIHDDSIRGKNSLPHIESLLNQGFENSKSNMKSISFTSEVNRIDPSNNNIVTIDNLIDYNIDQETDSLFKEQILFDLKRFYSKSIINALDLLSQYEPIEILHHALQKAMLDLLRGKYVAYPDAKEYSNSINHILIENGEYQDEYLAYEIRQSLIRSIRFIHSGKHQIKNKQAYFYVSIQKAIVDFIYRHYELERNEVVR